MKCPNCNTKNHAEDMVCLNCGLTLNKVPFTAEQKGWHVMNSIVPVIGLGILFFTLNTFTSVSNSFSGSSGFSQFSIIWWLFMAIAAIAISFSFYKNIMDLLGGVAQVHTARMIRKYRSGKRNSRTYYAEFEQIGKVSIRFNVYQQLSESGMYKVTYSPNTKRGWNFEQQ